MIARTVLATWTAFALLSSPVAAVTLSEFLAASGDFQAIYAAGALDAYILDQAPGPEQAECAKSLNVQSVYDEIAALLFKHPQLAAQNAAAVLLGVVHRRCRAPNPG